MATRVLIVNDDRLSAERCANALRARGYDVEAVPSASLAQHATRRTAPDVIMLDAVIALDREPGGSARRFTFDASRREIPIVLTKGAVHPPGFPFEEMARREGLPVAAFVRVCASPPELASAIEQARRPQCGATARGVQRRPPSRASRGSIRKDSRRPPPLS